MKTSLALLMLFALPAVAQAGIRVETYGAAAPPPRVDYWGMGVPPFRGDLFADVTSTPDWAGRSITFSFPVSVRAIGAGWATWSHGYTGNVFYSNGATSLTMTLEQIYAFQLYAEPNPFGVFEMTATGSDGSTSVAAPQFPDGSSGATGWGFSGTGGSHVASVTISSDVDFAVGEFASEWIPAPPGLAVFGLAALATGRRRC